MKRILIALTTTLAIATATCVLAAASAEARPRPAGGTITVEHGTLGNCTAIEVGRNGAYVMWVSAKYDCLSFINYAHAEVWDGVTFHKNSPEQGWLWATESITVDVSQWSVYGAQVCARLWERHPLSGGYESFGTDCMTL